ncbi:hypothetical protein LX69_01469 [Breznakibacter xylanolyticus]|uniref:Uncharacterized protein n=1 Tax=Breznakibacter xylanolyticus TaxID=990 RepID=A0A2W7Q6P5_9BACT|nr:hypothetical protein LX69_01469 [Breznakibacter xylanolyticus]
MICLMSQAGLFLVCDYRLMITLPGCGDKAGSVGMPNARAYMPWVMAITNLVCRRYAGGKPTLRNCQHSKTDLKGVAVVYVVGCEVSCVAFPGEIMPMYLLKHWSCSFEWVGA